MILLLLPVADTLVVHATDTTVYLQWSYRSGEGSRSETVKLNIGFLRNVTLAWFLNYMAYGEAIMYDGSQRCGQIKNLPYKSIDKMA